MSIFTIERKDNIVIVSMNDESQAQNVLNDSLTREFDSLLNDIESDPTISAMIFASSKADCFIAGADISMLQAVQNEAQALKLTQTFHNITKRMTDLKATTVAAIEGACLGGGLELALAFDYRIATTSRSTKLGLPEVQLGLLPGGGGTQRLPRLVSLTSALDLMLTGKQLNGKRAARIKLVDEAVASEILMSVASKYADKGKPNRKVSTKERLTSGNPLSRKVIFSQARKKILAATKGHYPAPLKILDVVEHGLSNGFDSGLQQESEQFAKLVMSPESAQLVNIFFATTDLKKDTGVDTSAKARPLEKIAVLGAGLMGAGIASVSIEKAGLDVRLKDIAADGLAKGVAYIGKIVDNKQRKRYINQQKRDRIMSRLSATTDYSGFKNADVVIEAVFEDLSLKQNMVADIEALGSSKGRSSNKMIFATNTSAIPIDDVANKAKNPERIIGMHYFSPVEKMPLLEVVTGTKTADWVTATAVELGKRQGKTVIVVNDGPGFYTTRVLAPYVMEAVRMVTEGVAIEDVDFALESFGFPVGPIKLMDEVGIDVGSHIGQTMNQAFGERIPLLECVQKVLDDDRKGRKNSRGFYKYDKSTKGKKEVDESIYSVLGMENPKSLKLSQQKIAERCVLTMVNEATFCYGDKILRSARDGDIGAIFGLGFPPFEGGPFRYADKLGIDNLVAKLEKLKQQHGAQFTVAPILLELQKKKANFY